MQKFRIFGDSTRFSIPVNTGIEPWEIQILNCTLVIIAATRFTLSKK